MAETTKKTTTRKKTTASASAPTGIQPKRQAKAKVSEIPSVSHEQIALLAHRFWNERGRQHGGDAADWLRAEQELIGKAS